MPIKKPCSKRDKLTDKEDAFCREYVVDFNGTQAVIRAGYSKKNARQRASQLVSKVYIQERIAILKAELAKTTEISAERVLKEIHKTAFFNIKDAMEWDGGVLRLKSFEDLPDDITANISSMKQNSDGSVEVKFYCKQKATDGLAKYFELYKDQVKSENAVTIMNVFASPDRKADGLLDPKFAEKHVAKQ